jgi:hypothetical protein
MVVARKMDVVVKAIFVCELEELATRHGDHLFGSSETAIVSHDSTDQAGAQKHVRSFN